MLDLYLVLVPLYAIITILNLIALKMSLADNTVIANLGKLKIEQQIKVTFQAQQSILKRNIKHFLTHFTFIEIFAVRRAKYKLISLLSVSLISIAAFGVASPFAFLFIGGVTYFIYFAVSLVLDKRERVQKEENEDKTMRQKYLMVICSLTTIVINLILIGLTFKNYKNSKLNAYANSFALNLLLDNFVARPIMSVLFAIPLSKIDAVNQFISQIQKQLTLLSYFENNLNGINISSIDLAKNLIGQKLGKRIPINMEMDIDLIRQEQLGNREKNMAKEFQRMKLMKNYRYDNGEAQNSNKFDQMSLNSLFNTSKKHDTSAQKQSNHIQERTQEITQNFQLKNKQNIHIKDNLLMIQPSRQQQDRDEQLNTEDIAKKMQTLQSKDEDNPSNFALKLISDDGVQLPIKLSYNEPSDPSGPSSKHQPLRIYINGQQKELEVEQQLNEVGSERYRRRNSINNQQYSHRNYGALEIKQNNNAIDQIEELDMNSPERRNRYNPKLEEDSIKLQAIIKKKKKKMSHDERNRVIKFTTGEPYLQYLPNMLSKESKSKKSQALGKKQHILDSRAISNISKKPPPKRKYNQNNENIIPQFHVQDL